MSAALAKCGATIGLPTPFTQSLALLPILSPKGGWTCERIDLTKEDRLVVRFLHSHLGVSAELCVRRGMTKNPRFKNFGHCSVGHISDVHQLPRTERRTILKLLLAMGHAFNARLEHDPEASLAQVLGRDTAPAKAVFSRDTLRALLAPDIVQDQEIVGGWSLRDVYPSTYMKESDADHLELVIELFRQEDNRRVLLLVRKRNDQRQAFCHTHNLDIGYLNLSKFDEDPGLRLTIALVSFVLQLKDHPQLDISFPDPGSDVAHQLLLPSQVAQPPSSAQDQVLNLAIDGDCHQACVFCSTKSLIPARDGGTAVLDRVCADLEAHRARGVHRVRINGLDPLAYSKILEILGRATALGYDDVTVFSPCTLLADRNFCEQIVAALPPKKHFPVPLYGVDPEIHDRVVGREGAAALVFQALENLIEMVGTEVLSIKAVATKDNLDQLIPLQHFCDQRGLAYNYHLPYPASESRQDLFYTSCPRHIDVVNALFESTQEHPARLGTSVSVGVMRCVAFHRFREVGIPLRSWLPLGLGKSELQQPGAKYRDPRFVHRASDNSAAIAPTIACPHVDDCVLKSACAKELYRAYVELYGIEEFRPVSLEDLLEAK